MVVDPFAVMVAALDWNAQNRNATVSAWNNLRPRVNFVCIRESNNLSILSYLLMFRNVGCENMILDIDTLLYESV